MKTEDVVINPQEDNRIILNCTYHKQSTEDISERDIIWRKQINDSFKDVAIFSPPEGPTPLIANDMKNLYENRTELIGPNTSLSAVMIINDPLCVDEGTYQCLIEYFDGIKKKETVSSVVVFNCK